MNEDFHLPSMADELESAAEFLTRKRGRVRARTVLVPVAILWLVAFAIAVGVGRQHRPELAPYTAALYVCTAFFAHAYTVAWRSGNVLWRYAALLVTTAFFGVLCFLHADDAGAWLIYTRTGVTARPPEPRLFVAVVLDGLAALLLLVHGFFLGLGSHTPRPRSASNTRSISVSANVRAVSAQVARLASSLSRSGAFASVGVRKRSSSEEGPVGRAAAGEPEPRPGREDAGALSADVPKNAADTDLHDEATRAPASSDDTSRPNGGDL